MKTLNLYRIWQILNFITDEENLLNEKNIYPSLLGLNSSYYNQSFDFFLKEYSFRIDEDEICVFNNDPIPYEDYTNTDFSYIQKELLKYNNDELIKWIDEQVSIHLERVEQNNKEEKENLQHQIELLTKILEKL